ncbi:MAG: FAD-dependent oxidoreductase [Nitrospirae bacterium]|nr:FAD-dependent oxidoreductase [Nitrospirota bacterium]
MPFYLAEASEKKVLSFYLRFSTLSPGDAPDEGYLKISVVVADGPEGRQRAITDALSVHRYLADRLEQFKDSYIAGTSQAVMQREGRRIRGEYTLTEDDILSARKFSDGIVKNSWPIEIWDRNKGTIYKYVPKDDYYEIPIGCLKVKGFKNLLCAGRCISVSREALGSTRVMGTCISLGEQAGMAAANKIKHGNYLLSENKI